MPEGFTWTIRGKLVCDTCGRSGWPGGRWLDGCKGYHPFGCHYCQKRFTSYTGKANHIRIKHPGKMA